jgi:hypothetical protein
MHVDDYKKYFKDLKEKVKEDENNFEERDFYSLIERIDFEIPNISERVFNHPKYNYEPTKEVPESILLDQFEKLKKHIEKYVKERQAFDPDEELDRMFPDRHDDGFDEDSMNYDSVFGKD